MRIYYWIIYILDGIRFIKGVIGRDWKKDIVLTLVQSMHGDGVTWPATVGKEEADPKGVFGLRVVDGAPNSKGEQLKLRWSESEEYSRPCTLFGAMQA
jgi:hypothetical protein